MDRRAAVHVPGRGGRRLAVRVVVAGRVARLRRGELCGLRWAAVDLDRGLLFVERQRTTAGYEVVEGDPKTAAGRRAVALARPPATTPRDPRRRQLAHRARRLTAGNVWHDSGYVFTRKDRELINPNYATTRFRKLTDRAGLP